MASTYATDIYPGNGSETEFDLTFKFISRDHVGVAVINNSDGAETILTVIETGEPVGNEYRWENDTRIKVGTAPTADQKIRIRRDTPENQQLVPWADGSYLLSEDLNTSDLQWLYGLQELEDKFGLLQTTAIKYLGAIDLTVDEAPVNPTGGDFFINTGAGTVIASWTGIAGDTVVGAEQVIYSAADLEWQIFAVPSSQQGVVQVTGTSPIAVDNTDTQRPDVSITPATASAAGSMSAADKAKLDGLPADAEANVNADWNAASGDAEILNKPSIPAAQVNSDWDATSGVAEILNKPAIIPEAPSDGKTYGRKDSAWSEVEPGGVTQIVAGNNVTITPSGGTGVVTVNSTGGGGSSTATIGAIVAWANSTVPTGWLECDGSPIPSQYTDLIALVGANTPDLRGEFVRGWDNGAGVDAGRALLSNQDDAFQDWTDRSLDKPERIQNFTQASGSTAINNSGIYPILGVSNVATNNSITMAFEYKNGTRVADETRPRNVALMYIINADGSSIGGGGSGSGVSSIIAGAGIAVDQATGDVTITNTGGGGGDVINYSGAAAWASVAADGTVENGLNVASVTISGNGYDVVFTTPMPDANYSVVGSINITSANCFFETDNKTATGFTYYVINPQAGTVTTAAASFQVAATNALPPKGTTGTDAWASVSSDGSVGASFNVASVTRTGTGLYDVVFTTPMPSGSYSVVTNSSNSYGTTAAYGYSSTGFTVAIRSTADSNSPVDAGFSFAVNATNCQLPNTVTQEQIESAINNPGLSAWGFVNNGTLQNGLNINSTISNPLTGVYDITFVTPMPDSNYSVVATSGLEVVATASNCSVGSKTPNGFQININTINSGAPLSQSFQFQVAATNALPPKGTAGTDAWASVQSDGTVDASFNCTVVKPAGSGGYDVTFNTPMPTANYAVTMAPLGTQTIVRYQNRTANGFYVTCRDVTTSGTAKDSGFSFTVNATNATLPSTFTEAQIQAVVDLAQNPQGIAKAWGSVNSGGTLAAVYNIASVTNSATGIYEVVFATPMPSAFYSVSTAVTSNTYAVARPTAKTANGFTMRTLFSSSGTPTPGAYSFDFQVFTN